MTPVTATHATLVIERKLKAAPARVFAAWAKPEAKARWFVGPDGWTLVERELDFRVGGRELLHGAFAGGRTSVFTAHYHHIEPDKRIVYAYEMHVDKRQISVSLATIELSATGAGTKLVLTEQGVFFDGPEAGASRERGTAVLMDQLVASLDG